MNDTRFYRWFTGVFAVLYLTGTAQLDAQEYLSGKVWAEPKVVDPGPPPSDAIVLFDGKDLSAWNGGEKWKIDEGVADFPRRRHQHQASFRQLPTARRMGGSRGSQRRRTRARQ